MASPREKATPEQVEQSIRDIDKYWHQGQESLRELPQRGSWGKNAIQAQAEKLGWTDTKLRKARQFAHPEKGYTKEQLKELFTLLRKHRPIFGIAFIGILVTVEWPLRARFQRACIRHNWSKSELEAAIKVHRPNQRQGGRRRRVGTMNQALVQLEEMTDSFARWIRVARESSERESEMSVFDQLPEDVRKELNRANKAMQRLREAVEMALNVVRSGKGPGD